MLVELPMVSVLLPENPVRKILEELLRLAPEIRALVPVLAGALARVIMFPLPLKVTVLVEVRGVFTESMEMVELPFIKRDPRVPKFVRTFRVPPLLIVTVPVPKALVDAALRVPPPMTVPP